LVVTREVRVIMLAGTAFAVASVLLPELLGVHPLSFVPLPILVVMAWGMVHAAMHRDSVWHAADQNKVVWGFVQLLPVVGTMAYLILVHRTLLDAEDRTRT